MATTGTPTTDSIHVASDANVGTDPFTQVVLGKYANLVNSVDHLFNNFPTKDYNFCYNDQIKCFLLLKEILSMTFFYS